MRFKILVVVFICFLMIPLGLKADEKEDFSIAKKFYDDELYSMATDALKIFIEKYPNSSLIGDANYWLGETLIKGGQFKEAEDVLQKVILLSGENKYMENVYHALAYAQLREKKFTEARTTLNNFITKFPNSDLLPSIYILTGEIFYEENNIQEAIINFNKALETEEPSSADEALYWLGKAYSFTKDWEKAEEHYQKIKQGQ